MDKHRLSGTKFSESLEPLSTHIKFNCDSETNSTITSNISVFKTSGDINSLLVNPGSKDGLGEIQELVGDNVDSPPKIGQKGPKSILKEPRISSLAKLGAEKQRSSEGRTYANEGAGTEVKTPKSI